MPSTDNHIQYGDKSLNVSSLQSKLIHLGFSLAQTGEFDQKTEDAVMACQQANGLVIDGECGEKTQAVLNKEPHDKFLKEADIIVVAELLEVDVPTVKAVNKVESAGSGFLKDGRVKILYERHIMYRELKKKFGVAVANGHKAKRPDICNTATGGYKGGVAEYPRQAGAKTMDEECALLSASYGLFQIMGFNFKACGFDDVFAYVAAQECCEGEQLKAFAHFVKAHKTMYQALKNQDWAAFAKAYNGPAYKKNHYDDKLKNAYANFVAIDAKLKAA